MWQPILRNENSTASGRPSLGWSLRGHARRRGFTIVEALIALFVLMIVAVGSTVTFNLFNSRAATNRNTEAARALVDDYVNYLLNDGISLTTATTDSGAVDGNGNQMGAICTALAGRYIPDGSTSTTATGNVSLVVARNASASPVVNGTLYWRVIPVGTTFSLTNNTDLMQVSFTLVYNYRNKTYYYQTMTFKGNNS